MDNFSNVMSQRSDIELLQIVTKLRNDYQAEAVVAAEAELKKRNLQIERLEEVNNEIHTIEQIQKEKEDQPLETAQKILFFIFFWGVIPWAMAGTFKANGYIRKHREAWKFMKYGLITFVTITLLLFLMVYFLV